MNYRCATVFGIARAIIAEPEKFAPFNKMVQRCFLGRTLGHNYTEPAAGDLGATRWWK